MKDDNNPQNLEEFQKKAEELKAKVEAFDARLAKPNHSLLLKPGGATERAVNKAVDEELIQQRKRAQDAYEAHMAQAPEGYTPERSHHHEDEEIAPKSDPDPEPEQTKKPETFQWLHDPENAPESNVLAHDVDGLSIAQVERLNETSAPESPEIYTQLFLYDPGAELWQDGGAYEYEDAIRRAEEYAIDYETEYEADISNGAIDPDLDHDV